MNIKQYANLLALLPFSVKALDFERLQTCQLRGQLIVCHPDSVPLVFRNGSWEEMKFVSKAKS